MEKQQSLEILELTKSVVRGTDSLVALITRNTNSDVGLGNHTYVIGSITDRECDFVGLELFDQLDYFCLLFWRESARNDNLTRESQLHEAVDESLRLLNLKERFSFNDGAIFQFWQFFSLFFVVVDVNASEYAGEEVHYFLFAVLFDLEDLHLIVQDFA